MKTPLTIVCMIMIMCTTNAHQKIYAVAVGGHIAKPGRYKLLSKPESIAQLLNRVGGIPVPLKSFQAYQSGKMVHEVDIVFHRDGKKIILRLGRDDEFMRKTMIKDLDTFNVRRLLIDDKVKFDRLILIKKKK